MLKSYSFTVTSEQEDSEFTNYKPFHLALCFPVRMATLPSAAFSSRVYLSRRLHEYYTIIRRGCAIVDDNGNDTVRSLTQCVCVRLQHFVCSRSFCENRSLSKQSRQKLSLLIGDGESCIFTFEKRTSEIQSIAWY